jgi:hypothetical protein
MRTASYYGSKPFNAARSQRERINKKMPNKKAWKLYQRYVDGWRAIPLGERKALIADVVAEHAKYMTPQHATGGRETMIEDMAAFQSKYPGGWFEVGNVSAHHDVALLTWVLVQPDGNVLAKGHDQIRISAEGKIAELITFAPSVSEP